MSQRNITCALLTLALFIGLAATPAQGAAREEEPAGGFYYLFTAQSLDYPTGHFSIRIEYRDGDRVVGTETYSLSFRDRDTALLAVAESIASLALELEGGEVWVFANDLLVNTFDRDSLAAYNKVLRYTSGDEMQSATRHRGERRSVGIPNKIYCQSPCNGGCGPNDDYDCDGVINSVDNCTDDPNSNQSDCDNDGFGDVCDVIDGIFSPQGSEKTCMTDKDFRWNGAWFEHHVEQRLVDTSSCNSPDEWDRRVRSWAWCGSYSFNDKRCCEDGIGTSIQQVGDSYTYWCQGGVRNIDFCH